MNKSNIVEKVKPETITMLPSVKEKALKLSNKLLGETNLSGIIRYLINKESL